MAVKTLALCCLLAVLPNSAIHRGKGAIESPYRQAAIIGQHDPRIAIVPGAGNKLLTLFEVKQSMVSMGVIKCPGTDLHNGTGGTATVVIRDDTIVTDAHIFWDDKFRRRSPIDQCFFINSQDPNHRHHVILEKDNYSRDDPRIDYAIARLDSPVEGAVPYKIDNSGDRPADNDDIVVITNNLDNGRFNARQRVQLCHVRRGIEVDEFGHKAFLTDCATNPGDSGAPVFARSPTGELHLKGLNIGQAIGTAEHCAYDDDACSGRVVAIGRAFLSDLASFTHHRKR